MKTFLTSGFVLFLVLNVFSQRTPESFIGAIPPLPNGVCSITDSQMEAFSQSISDLSEQIAVQANRMGEERNSFARKNTGKMKQNIAQENGLSSADLSKGEISEADAMAMANKMMGKKLNMSMDEAKSLEKLNPDGQKAWADAYSTQKMAEAQADPGKNKADLKKNTDSFTSAKEKKDLSDKHRAMTTKFQQQYMELDREANESQTFQKINELKAKLQSTIGTSSGSGLIGEVRALQIKYCNEFSPRYVDLYTRELQYIKTYLPDYYRMEELDKEEMAVMTGVKDKTSERGFMALTIVSGYINRLKDVFKYKLTRDE